MACGSAQPKNWFVVCTGTTTDITSPHPCLVDNLHINCMPALNGIVHEAPTGHFSRAQALLGTLQPASAYFSIPAYFSSPSSAL